MVVREKSARGKVRVLFVCLGNICRSPTAEGVFRHLLSARELTEKVTVDSAGTSGWHIGEAPDERAQEEALGRGIDLSDQRSRAVRPRDFQDFDYIVAMDGENLADLQRMAVPGARARLCLCTDFAPQLGIRDVPDPYYGGPGGFGRVFDIIEAGARGLLAEIEQGLLQRG